MKSQKKRKQEIVKATKAKEKQHRERNIGDTINAAYEEIPEERIEVIMPYKKGDFVTGGTPKWQVEMMLGQALGECKRAADAYIAYLYLDTMTRMDGWRNVYIICVQEAHQALDNLSTMKDVSLCSKHRQARKLWRWFQDDLRELYEDMMSETDEETPSPRNFGIVLTQFFTDMHLVMHEDTPKKEKRKIMKVAAIGRDDGKNLSHTRQTTPSHS